MDGFLDACIRLATDADLEAVTACVQAAFSPWTEIIGRRPFALDTDYMSRIEDGYVHLAIEGGEILGVIALWPEDESVYIDTLAVDPSRQKRGVGKLLLDFAESHARALGKTTMSLRTNEKMQSNRAYYQKLGYQEIRSETFGLGRKTVWMEKPLMGDES